MRMREQIRVTVGVPTRNRLKDLLCCLRSVAAQTLAPIEVLVIDDGNLSPGERELCRQAVESRSLFRYFKKDFPSLARSKNLIAEKAEGDFVLILDDDTVPERDYLEKLAECFLGDTGGKIGAVGGYIANIRRQTGFERIWRRIFLLDSSIPGDITPTMFESRHFESLGICEVKWLPGGITMYRTRILKEFPFEDFWGGRNGLEEVEHAIQVRRHYRYLLNPAAVIYHNTSPVSRESMYTTGFKHAYNRCAIFTKYAPSCGRTPLLAWSFLGYLFGLALSGKMAVAQGNAAGLCRFLYDRSRELLSRGGRREVD
jgi:GT2 family glycosyltransferase